MCFVSRISGTFCQENWYKVKGFPKCFVSRFSGTFCQVNWYNGGGESTFFIRDFHCVFFSRISGTQGKSLLGDTLLELKEKAMKLTKNLLQTGPQKKVSTD